MLPRSSHISAPRPASSPRTSSPGAKRALKVRQIWAIQFFVDREGRMRDRALFDLAIDSELCGCDLVKLKIGTLVTGHDIRAWAMVIQQKTSFVAVFRKSRVR